LRASFANRHDPHGFYSSGVFLGANDVVGEGIKPEKPDIEPRALREIRIAQIQADNRARSKGHRVYLFEKGQWAAIDVINQANSGHGVFYLGHSIGFNAGSLLDLYISWEAKPGVEESKGVFHSTRQGLSAAPFAVVLGCSSNLITEVTACPVAVTTSGDRDLTAAAYGLAATIHAFYSGGMTLAEAVVEGNVAIRLYARRVEQQMKDRKYPPGAIAARMAESLFELKVSGNAGTIRALDE
jgi:hypothetical protein